MDGLHLLIMLPSIRVMKVLDLLNLLIVVVNINIFLKIKLFHFVGSYNRMPFGMGSCSK